MADSSKIAPCEDGNDQEQARELPATEKPTIDNIRLQFTLIVQPEYVRIAAFLSG